jgi:hypothetical protein
MAMVADDTRAYIENELDVADVSPLGLAVATLLDEIWGLHNFRRCSSLRTANWREPNMIRIGFGASLATFDGDQLTQLVVRCHDACVRLEVEPLNAKMLRLIFSRRDRVGHRHERHPSLADAIAHVRASSYYGAQPGAAEREGR